ncbi:MAG: hypothetical protein AVDCRST_MAG45-2576, partial [uncultured Solirubrobacterales bacterium]
APHPDVPHLPRGRRPVPGRSGRHRRLRSDLSPGRRRRAAGAPARPRPAHPDRRRRSAPRGPLPARLRVRGREPRLGPADRDRQPLGLRARHDRRSGDRACRRLTGLRAERRAVPLHALAQPRALALPRLRPLRAPARLRPRPRTPRPQDRLLPRRSLRPGPPAPRQGRGPGARGRLSQERAPVARRAPGDHRRLRRRLRRLPRGSVDRHHGAALGSLRARPPGQRRPPGPGVDVLEQRLVGSPAHRLAPRAGAAAVPRTAQKLPAPRALHGL